MKRIVALAVLSLLLALPLLARRARAEVVVTIPTETSLADAGARPAAAVWPEMVAAARRSVDLAEFYLVSQPGSRLEPTLAALQAAARRGVRVRVLAEQRMAATYPEVLAKLRALPGAEVRLFDWRGLGGGILHAKYMVVDGREGYVGSQNFDWRSLEHIHETGLRVRDGRICAALQAIFDADWAFSGGDGAAYEQLQRAGPFAFSPRLRLTASPAGRLPPGVEPSLPALVSLLDGARRSVTVQLLSYSSDNGAFTALRDALQRAARRGAVVRMVVADWNLRARDLDGLRELARTPGIELRVASIPQASQGFIPYARVVHSKVARIDGDLCWVGTSNWAGDYFLRSRNVEVIARDAALARRLDRLFASLWQSPYVARFDPARAYEPPRLE